MDGSRGRLDGRVERAVHCDLVYHMITHSLMLTKSVPECQFNPNPQRQKCGLDNGNYPKKLKMTFDSNPSNDR